ncbi:MAG: hypothetical protein IJ684_02550 [Bacteroidales bacterium]|nr:hypothetical protein [Bacteroidales bacterium]
MKEECSCTRSARTMVALSLFCLMAVVACRPSPVDPESEVADLSEEEEYYRWECASPYGGCTERQLQQLVQTSLANGDKETFADLVQYPIRRDYPLRAIRNREQMVANFDLIFDSAFRQKVATLDSSAWETYGWRGMAFSNGAIWGPPVWAITYSSPQEQRFRQAIIEAEVSQLHPSLRTGTVIPQCRLQLVDERYSFARIDYVDNAGDASSYRLTIFGPNASVGDLPVVELYGEYSVEGTMCIEDYIFEWKGGTLHYSPNDGGEMEGYPDYIRFWKDNEFLWKIPVSNNSFYQPNPLVDEASK